MYNLFDKRRVIAKGAMARALTLQSEGGNAFLRTMGRKGVRSAISDALWDKIQNPIFFRYLDTDSGPGGVADGYEATTLIEVCDALIQARTAALKVVRVTTFRLRAMLYMLQPLRNAAPRGNGGERGRGHPHREV